MKTILKILMLSVFFSANGQTVSNEMVLDTITMFKTEKIILYRPESIVFSVDSKHDGCFYDFHDFDNQCLITIVNMFNTRYSFSEEYKLYKSVTTENGIEREYFCCTEDDGTKRYSRRDSYYPPRVKVVYQGVPEEKLEEYDFYLDSVVLMLGQNSYPPSRETECDEE